MKELVLVNYYDNKDIIKLEWGFCKKFIFYGPFYALKKGNTYIFSIVGLLELIIFLAFILIFGLKLGIIASIVLIIIINTLFALNYNLIVVESYLKENYIPYDYNSSNLLIKKGIYFKLN